MRNRFLIPFLLVINAAIIIGAESASNGATFLRVGLIHLAALFFCVLTAYTIFRQWRVQKNALFPILKGVLIASAVFSLAHLIAFSLESPALGAGEFTDVAVLFCYTLGSLIILGGYTAILKMAGRSKQMTSLVPGVIGALLGSVLFVTAQGITPLRDPISLLPSFLVLLNSYAIILLIHKNGILEKMMPSLSRFFLYSKWSIFVIGISAILEFAEAYEVLPGHQAEYLPHFFFYAGLSLQIIALNSIFSLGGVYTDLRNEK